VTFELDRRSLLVRVPGAATLSAVEGALARDGLTLGLSNATDVPVAEWLANGAPGAPSGFADPADHIVAGLGATLAGSSERLEVRPSPRRAVGPDLVALCLGARERFASIDHVWLRVHRKDARRVALSTEGLDLDPPVSPEESALLDAIARELTRST
jgi:alkyldihydroxyacetonephosphate synthase